jgi:hypothetical protein
MKRERTWEAGRLPAVIGRLSPESDIGLGRDFAAGASDPKVKIIFFLRKLRHVGYIIGAWRNTGSLDEL